MDTTVAAALGLGFVLGLRHALDPDHVVAVSTIVSEHNSLARSSLIGTFWGLGHSASLFAVGVMIILLRVSIPEQVLPWMELPVAAMLIFLGISAMRRAVRERGLQIHTHVHEHGDKPHAHVHVHVGDEHNHVHRMFKIGGKPFAVGLVHGFAGSATLTLLVLAQIPSVALGLVYMAVFGIGSIGGMLIMSAMISVPFVLTARRFEVINSVIRLSAGLFSLAFGLMIAWGLLREAFSSS
ncbi:MAG: urease accessory protein UreH [Blastocatellia bacterium]